MKGNRERERDRLDLRRTLLSAFLTRFVDFLPGSSGRRSAHVADSRQEGLAREARLSFHLPSDEEHSPRFDCELIQTDSLFAVDRLKARFHLKRGMEYSLLNFFRCMALKCGKKEEKSMKKRKNTPIHARSGTDYKIPRLALFSINLVRDIDTAAFDNAF